MLRTLIGLTTVVATACGGNPGAHSDPPPVATPTPAWPVPVGWRAETIPFPLDFAPTLTHRGAEELRFPAGFFEPGSADYWSYAFVWRLDDDPALDAAALAAELTTYFRGLIAAVDDGHRITDRDAVVATATAASEPTAAFTLTAHVFDAFKTALPLDLRGTAVHTACPGGGSLWTFVLTPDPRTLPQLAELAGKATCAQHPPR